MKQRAEHFLIPFSLLKSEKYPRQNVAIINGSCFITSNAIYRLIEVGFLKKTKCYYGEAAFQVYMIVRPNTII